MTKTTKEAKTTKKTAKDKVITILEENKKALDESGKELEKVRAELRPQNESYSVTDNNVAWDYETMIINLDEVLRYMEHQDASDDLDGYVMTFTNALKGIVMEHDAKLKSHRKALRK